VLISVSIGFMLPVFACGVLGVTAVIGAGILGASSPTIGSMPTSSGFGDAVAIVRVEGTILSSDSTDFSADAVSSIVISNLEAAANDPSIKAIVLRVDSPGGSVTGSAQIWEALNEMEKPVVASMASIAASGGYYVSAPADYIIARPDTLTGSLGVIMTLFDASELLEKVGVKVDHITSGDNKAMGSMWVETTPDQRQILQDLANEAYDDFVLVIASGRGLSEEEVRVLADGRVYSGQQALEHNLIDQVGNFQDAIDKAAELGGISGKPRLVEYEQTPTLLDMLMGASTQFGKSDAERAMELVGELTAPMLEYRYVGPGAE
jgi:protease-4